MAASRLSTCVAAALAAASFSAAQNKAYADGFRFNPFSSSNSSSQQQKDQSQNSKPEEKREAEEPRGSGFDPEALERGAKALREINSSSHAKQVSLQTLFFMF